ncbi:hybrid sensor histidine kinase/response regulator [Allgaiera indica]|uniref:histidine kinase n=1 Tax=Allgaiera indica TaxID=765699 RepID=A0AAN4UUX0_9RHOB|nr:hybrid sensor histidine kinase/response regulator [Allgaiera indica]
MGFALAIVAILSAIAVLMVEVVARMDSLQTAEADNLQWSLSQVEVEFLLLEDAVTVARMTHAAPLGPELAAVRKRFNLFYSQLRTVQTSPHFSPVRDDGQGGAAIAHIGKFTMRMMHLVDGPDAALAAQLDDIGRQMAMLRPDVRALTVQGLGVFARIADQSRAALGATLMRLAALTFALIVVLGGLAGALAWLNRVNHARMAEIARTRARLQTILATALDAVLVTDARGRLQEMNRAAEEMFGLDAATARGRALNQMVAPTEAAAAQDVGLAAYLVTGEPATIGQGRRRLQGRRADGKVFPVELALAAAQGGEGGDMLCIAIVRDISDQDAADRALREARDRALAGERAKAEFLAVMSHEMRTPLNGLLGTIELLAQEHLSPKQAEYVEVMQSSGRHLLRHVNDVLDIARAESGRAPAALEPVDLAQLLEEVAAGQRGLAEAGGNRLRLDLPDPPLPPAEGDPARLRQVILNLVGNAVKFTENGAITLSLKLLADDRVELRVTDTGPGIAAEDLDRVFADFVTLDASYRRNVAGTGLGLGIARRMVAAMEGEIGVDSTPGQGSSFWVRLPFRRATALPATRPAPPQALPRTRPLDLLVVEDNRINRFVVREMLEGMGHSVTQAADGQEGAALATAKRFDAILMDISMPRLDGVEAARRIRAASDGSSRAPIVALTAHAQPAEHARFRAAGMTESLTKPITRAALAAVLHRILGEGDAPAAAAASTPQDEAGLLDLGHLVEMSEQLGAAFPGLLRRFEEEGAALLGAAPTETLPPKALHRLAGSASVFGAVALQARLARAEAAAEAGTDVDLASLRALWCRTLSALRAALDEDEDPGAAGGAAAG